ncbi:helix-turn-helix transcriptional regulator [Streptomyces sp. NPDC048324]|uniref:helix-turn-helix domain-containing protein n=1 Tax=Streptomyces sp. NPDC048324 TaxID=3157205 RepID=UPI00341B0AE3
MTEDQQRAFGRRVAELRKAKGYTQQDLAARINKTASWVSQVERGVLVVQRLDVLRDLADALGVSMQRLEPSVPSAEAEEVATDSEVNDLDGARVLISGHPALDALLPPADGGEVAVPSLDELVAQVDHVWELAHSSQFADLSAELQQVIPILERTSRAVDNDRRPEVLHLLARTYQALAASFVRQDEADAAWVAADRSIRAAEESGQPLEVCAGIFRLAHAFVRLKRLDQAEHAARTALQTLKAHLQNRQASPQERSIMGALHLVLALIHSRGSRRPEARAEINEARAVAQALGEDRNDYHLEFGPTNVELWAVAIAVELGDAGEAIDIGEAIDATGLSSERQARLLMDLGRAYVQRRQVGEALDALLRAEELAPEMVRSHVAGRKAIHELILLSGRGASRELLDLAERADATE